MDKLLGTIEGLSARDDFMLLRDLLEGAVPLWLLQWRDTDTDWRSERMRLEAAVLAADSDCLIRKVPGRTARAFNALARALALLAFAPGGVTAFGLHFEYIQGSEPSDPRNCYGSPGRSRPVQT